ncbi:ROK family protein [Brevibacillus centrosporus]|uniref:ROK family protein n=1 Tax=Brevibacillus centrosporus TaxID=54910 RepID=UPI000F0A0A9A|nr:ROK family protein [Brevibacillus centrosporus]MEC2129046.1 ROK family protein [Brevibacillus centrosporus]RNB70592.1 ROK family protein [Brevibacillus centrosporus]GED29274.1 glucokinase [Brevibacillus centrosporus]
MDRNEYAIGLDLGGTKILAGLIDGRGQIVSQKQLPTSSDDGEQAVINRVLAAIEAVMADASVEGNQVRGVGIASAGVIDSAKNEVIFASNLGWRNVPIGQLIQERFDLPAYLMNDANASAVAEWMWGAGKGTQNMIYVTVSTGVGAGIICNGRLLTGNDGSAGEFGHISIDWKGPICRCGNRGCLENYSSGTAIENMARTKIANRDSSFSGSLLEGHEALTAKQIGEAALQGDRFSIGILKQAGFYLGIGATNLIHLFNPELLVFGGGVMNSAPVILEEIEKGVTAHCIPGLANQVRVELNQLGTESGVMGAAGLLFSTQERSGKYSFL